MPPDGRQRRRSNAYELHSRHSSVSSSSAPASPDADRDPDRDPAVPSSPGYYDSDDAEEDLPLIEARGRPGRKRSLSSSSRPRPWWWLCSPGGRHGGGRRRPGSRARRRLRCLGRLAWRALLGVLGVCVAAVVLTALFGRSYTKAQYPASWQAREKRVRDGGGANPDGYWRRLPGEDGRTKTTADGRGNPDNVRVFLAANIINAELIAGEWGDRVLELMDLLGQENVFLSIFENDSGVETKEALGTLSARVSAHLPNAGQSIVSTTLPLSGVPRVRLPSGDTHVKRITYLAEVRNRALLPLVGTIPSLARWNETGYPPSRAVPPPQDIGEWEVLAPIPPADLRRGPRMPGAWVEHPERVSRIVFLNDVVFDPLEVLHLVLDTNDGDYAAACGLDYINPFKYYDTFATRDAAGSSLGVPFFPYFTPGASRAAILSGASPLVPVKACWGGVVAFDAAPFVRAANPVRFRSEKEPYWDASECCLVHADIDDAPRTFVNPFVRSAYDAATFRRLAAVRTVERVFALPHRLLVAALGMPWGGRRRTEREGDAVREPTLVVVAADGTQTWALATRVARKGGFCGSPKLLVMTEEADGSEKGKRGWRGLPVPKPPPELVAAAAATAGG